MIALDLTTSNILLILFYLTFLTFFNLVDLKQICVIFFLTVHL